MRKASNVEIVKLSKDIYYLINYLKNYGIDENIINGIQILIADKTNDIPSGSSGQVLDKNTIAISINSLSDDNNRKLVLYHELSHLLFGAMNENNREKIVEIIIKMTKNISDEYRKDIQLNMLDGFRLIEEYICESLPINIMVSNALIEKPIKKEKKHVLTGNYIYKSTFSGSYGIIEDILDNFFGKVYNGILINDLNNYEFYSKIISSLKEEEDIINILCTMGNIYNKMMIFAKEGKIYSCESEIKKLETLINNIEIKSINRKNI